MASKGGSWKGGRFRAAGRSASGGGGGGRGGGARSGATSILRGLKDSHLSYIRDPSSFREDSFKTVRGVYKDHMTSGKSATHVAAKVLDPVRLSVSSGKVHVTDGRHRLSVAREMGAKKIRAKVTEYGPRGGIRSQRTVVIPLR